MDKREIRNAVVDVLDLIENERRDAEDNVTSLEHALDKLALARHYLRYKFDEGDYPDPPGKNYDKVREIVNQRFPGFGFYNVVLDVAENLTKTKMVVGDAIDDLTDIVIELYNVIWCWENTSEADALWRFETMYKIHWGEHLRKLQLYIHDFKRER